MTPPPIGEALGEGWKAVKANLVTMIICTVVMFLLGFIPLVGGIFGMAAMYIVSLKAVRGQKPEIGDMFQCFSQAVDVIVMGIFVIIGVILCGIGVVITQGLFVNGMLLVVDKKMSWSDAKDKCMSEIKPNMVPWIIFVFVVGLAMGLIGTLLCGVGLLVTLPIAHCAIAYAYDKNFGKA